MEKNIVLISLFSASIAVLGLAPKVMIASGVPITAQSMGIMPVSYTHLTLPTILRV